MLFTRIHTYYFPIRKEELKSRLVGKHVKIHNLDFEVFEKDLKLSIVPHAEQEESIKTLPITSVVFNEEGNKTKVTVTSRMRQLDSGGPLLIILFCTFMVLASLFVYNFNREPFVTFTLLGLSAAILAAFGIRLQMGYFDYVRKVRAYIKSKADPVLNAGNMKLAA